MTTVAVLAPVDFEATAEQLERAHRATLQQMMLIARGHAVDSTEVRCAAELVCSALTESPTEVELAATVSPEPEIGAAPAATEAEKPADWKQGRSYDRYLRTIMSHAA